MRRWSAGSAALDRLPSRTSSTINSKICTDRLGALRLNAAGSKYIRSTSEAQSEHSHCAVQCELPQCFSWNSTFGTPGMFSLSQPLGRALNLAKILTNHKIKGEKDDYENLRTGMPSTLLREILEACAPFKKKSKTTAHTNSGLLILIDRFARPARSYNALANWWSSGYLIFCRRPGSFSSCIQ